MKHLVCMIVAIAALGGVATTQSDDTVRVFVWDNDAGESVQEYPAACMDGYGYSYYVWSDKRDNEYNIYGQQFYRNSKPWALNILINDDAHDGVVQRYPSVGCDASGNFTVAWVEGSSRVIKARQFNYLNQPQGASFIVNGSGTTDRLYPKVAVNHSTGYFAVVWMQDNGSTRGYDIMARLYKNTGVPVTSPVLVNDDGSTYDQGRPCVAYNDTSIVIAWEDYSTGDWDIFARLYMPDNLEPKAGNFQVSDYYSNANSRYTAIAISDTGYFVISWRDTRNYSGGDIYFQQFYPNGAWLENNTKANTAFGTNVTNTWPSLAKPYGRGFLVSWAEKDLSNAYGYQIKERYFDFRPVGGPVRIVNEIKDNDQIAPAACGYKGWASVVWADKWRDSRGDIFGQVFQAFNNSDGDSALPSGDNYQVDNCHSAGRTSYYRFPNYDNPLSPGWSENPRLSTAPESLLVPHDSAIVRMFLARNLTPGQSFFKVTDTDTLLADNRPQKINAANYDICVMDLAYADGANTAGSIDPAQQDTLVAFADAGGALLCTGNDFGEMYNATTLFSKFGAYYDGPGNASTIGNLSDVTGVSDNFCAGMEFRYPYQGEADNSVDVIHAVAPQGDTLFVSSAKGKWIRCVGASYSDYYKGANKAVPHRNVYLPFTMGSLYSDGSHPGTQTELMRRITAFQGFNVEPEPVTALSYVSFSEGAVTLSWTAVSDDDLAEAASKYQLKFRRYDPARSDSGKFTSETAYSDSGLKYYQSWTPLSPGTAENRTLRGLPPGDTLIFALKAGDESTPTRRWGAIGNEPLVIVPGDTVTPHTVHLGYTYGCVRDFINSERIDIRSDDTLWVTWNQDTLYLGYSRCDWRNNGDLFLYMDTRSGGADSTVKGWNTGDSASTFDSGNDFRPDFCLVFDTPSNSDSVRLKKWNSLTSAWIDSICPYTTSCYSLDSVNGYQYLELKVPFGYIKYDTLAAFRYMVLCANETNEHTWNAFPPLNNVGKAAKAPLTRYPYYYSVSNGLKGNRSPRNSSLPLSVELSSFSAASVAGGVELRWSTASENDNYAWIIRRSDAADGDYTTIATIPALGGSIGHAYSYCDATASPNASWYYLLGDQDLKGNITWHGPVSASAGGSPVTALSLLPCRPNPASGHTLVAFALPIPGRVNISVYDITGRMVKNLVDADLPARRHTLAWSGENDLGRLVSSGVYFIRLSFGGSRLTRKVTLVR
ncbi:MAG: T9SS type A sorting domain-containing protein [Candidatus Edwardsbacteria bacterium]|nr:T9SS type A sorting domain-containing protein [Candidatus Edwardsbacteria bacterium]